MQKSKVFPTFWKDFGSGAKLMVGGWGGGEMPRTLMMKNCNLTGKFLAAGIFIGQL